MQNPTRGHLVRTLREQAGLSQEELAVRAQVSRATVQNIERDRTEEPRRAVLRRLAEALGTNVAALSPAQPLTLEEITAKRAQLLAALAELDALEQGRNVG